MGGVNTQRAPMTGPPHDASVGKPLNELPTCRRMSASAAHGQAPGGATVPPTIGSTMAA